MPATRWNWNNRDKKFDLINLFLKVQKLLNMKFERSDTSIDKIGAISGIMPKYLVKKTYIPKLIKTPEKPTIEYFTKSLCVRKPNLGIFQINSSWSAAGQPCMYYVFDWTADGDVYIIVNQIN